MFAILSGLWEIQKEEEEARGGGGKKKREGGREGVREVEKLVLPERTLKPGVEKQLFIQIEHRNRHQN